MMQRPTVVILGRRSCSHSDVIRMGQGNCSDITLTIVVLLSPRHRAPFTILVSEFQKNVRRTLDKYLVN